MADTEVRKQAIDKDEVRPTKDDEVLIVDTADNTDIVLSTKGPKRPSKSRVSSCRSKMVDSPKII